MKIHILNLNFQQTQIVQAYLQYPLKIGLISKHYKKPYTKFTKALTLILGEQ